MGDDLKNQQALSVPRERDLTAFVHPFDCFQ